MPKTIVINSDTMGRGDNELGTKLIGSFLRTLAAAETAPAAVVFYNAGVRLAAADSPVLDALEALEQAGVDLLACGTCLAHYGLQDRLAAGRESNMQEIVTLLTGPNETVTI
jgi:selenium metabolism protein YedF